jgi:cholesterol transport system auxiliary component
MKGQIMKGQIMRFQPMLKSALATALVLALGGCISLGGKVPETLLSLTSAKSPAAGTSASGKIEDAIVVAEPETDRRLAVQRVAVQINDASVAYLQNAMWVERPSRLFRALLAETIRARGSRLVFEDSEATAQGGVRLTGRLLEMGYDARSLSVVVRYDAIRSGKGGELATRRFESVVPGIAAKPEAVGPALNKAANDVAAQVAEWVG